MEQNNNLSSFTIICGKKKKKKNDLRLHTKQKSKRKKNRNETSGSSDDLATLKIGVKMESAKIKLVSRVRERETVVGT